MGRIKALCRSAYASRWPTSWSWKHSSWCSRNRHRRIPRRHWLHFWKSARPILYACARSMHRALAIRDSAADPANLSPPHRCLRAWTFPARRRARARPRACLQARCAVPGAGRLWCRCHLKVEHPGRGDDTRDWGMRIGKTRTTYYNSMNRNKRFHHGGFADARRREDHPQPAAAVRRGDAELQDRRRREAGAWAASSSRPSSPI